MTIPAPLWIGAFRFALLAVAGFAIWRGGGPERGAAVAFLIAGLLSASRTDKLHAFNDLELGVAAVDLLLLAVLWTISIYANRWWTIPATGAQLVTCLAHLVKLAQPEQDQLAYFRMAAFSGWPTVIMLLIATLAHSWRAGRGVDPSWRKSLPVGVRRILARLRLD